MDLVLPTLAVSFVLLLAGVLYGLSQAFESYGLRKMAEEEFLQAVISAALLGAFTSIVFTAQAISQDLRNETNCSGLLNCSCAYLNISTGALTNASQRLTAAAYLIGYYQAARVEIAHVSLQPFNGLQGLLQSIALSQVFTALVMQVLYLGELAFNGLQNLLSPALALGIFLRCFRPTREIGDTLIILTIVYYILSPLVFLSLAGAPPTLNASINESAPLRVSLVEANDTLVNQLDQLQQNDFAAEVQTFMVEVNQFIARTAYITIVLVIALIIPLLSLFVIPRGVNIWNFI